MQPWGAKSLCSMSPAERRRLSKPLVWPIGTADRTSYSRTLCRKSRHCELLDIGRGKRGRKNHAEARPEVKGGQMNAEGSSPASCRRYRDARPLALLTTGEFRPVEGRGSLNVPV